MPAKAKTNEIEQNYNELFRGYGDEQLRDVLKKRKLYQADAAKAAIGEAINRGLIHSESDLEGSEFVDEPLRARLFPHIESSTIRKRIRKSLGRGLLLAGLLPLIRGIVLMNSGVPVEGAAVLTFGVIWMGCSALIIRNYSKAAIQLLFFLMLLSAIYIVRWSVISPSFAFMDVFIPGALFLLMAYGLLFALRLKE